MVTSITAEPDDYFFAEELVEEDGDTATLHATAEASDDGFDEWCRAMDEDCGDYPDREAYEAGRYIVTATGGR